MIRVSILGVPVTLESEMGVRILRSCFFRRAFHTIKRGLLFGSQALPKYHIYIL